jgi:hypothetical protein
MLYSGWLVTWIWIWIGSWVGVTLAADEGLSGS